MASIEGRNGCDRERAWGKLKDQEERREGRWLNTHRACVPCPPPGVEVAGDAAMRIEGAEMGRGAGDKSSQTWPWTERVLQGAAAAGYCVRNGGGRGEAERREKECGGGWLGA